MAVSLKDIATALNLSTTTVSWVLAGKGNERAISRQTQQRIIECAKQMAYKPNLIARSLNLGVSKTLGLILPSINDRFYSQIAEEIEREAKRFGYALMLCNSESQPEKEELMVNMLRAKQVDGIILAPTKLSDACIRSMLDDDFPFVLFDRYFDNIDTNYVVMDNESCSFKLVDHLIKKGHKKIGVITTNPHLLTLQQRYIGYCRAHEANGIPIDSTLKVNVEFKGFEHNIVSSLDELFATHPDIDSMFFISHILAVEALVYMYERGMDVNRFGLACIHEVSTFRALAPRINTARIPVEAMGREAVRILIKNVEQKQGDSDYLPAYKNAVTVTAKVTFRD